MYDFEIERINDEIKKRKAKRVLIQLPEGLKAQAPDIMKQIKAETVLSADPCFGACDIITTPETDLTMHFGHIKMLDTKNIIYIETHSHLEVIPVIDKAIPLLKGTVGLVTTAQHLHKLKGMKQHLEEHGIKVVLGKTGLRTKPGHVLGCDFTSAINADADMMLFVGSGKFHSLGVAYFTGKKTVQANPYDNSVEIVDASQWEKEKWLRISKAGNARSFGIIYGLKPGQKNFALADSLRKMSKENSHLIALSSITPANIDYLPFDAFVITACPRIVIDDWKNYRKPVLLPEEFKEIIKKK